MDNYFTLDEINDVIEVFENFLRVYNITIPDSEEEKVRDNVNSDSLIYGTVYSNLQFDLLLLFENLEKKNKVATVVNSWGDEVKEWGDDDEI